MADYHSLLMRAVANLPNSGTPASRGAIYERARKALLEQLRSLRPPLPESDITREETALDAAIVAIEDRYRPQDPAAPVASPTPTSALAGKPIAAPRAAPPPPPPQFSTVQRPSAPAAPGPSVPPARSPSQTGAALQLGAAAVSVQGAAHRPSPLTQGGSQPAGRPPQAPTPVAGRPGAVGPTVASPARSQLAAAMANQPSSAARTSRTAPSVGALGGKDGGLPGLAALDPAKAVRPTKNDDGNASDAPPVIASRRDEPGQWAEAPEVAAEVDRPGLTSRPEAETQRPVAPGAEVAKPKRLFWVAAAVVLGIVLAVAGAAILMRQKPQDLAIKPAAEAQQPVSPAPSAKIAERVQTTPTATTAPASTAQTTPSSPQSAAAPASPAAPEAPNQPAQSATPAPSAGRAAMLIASADNPQKPSVNLGSTVWSLIPPAPGQPATVGVKAEADIPDLKMHATMTLRKNSDPTLQATHTIDLKFSFAPGAPITGFKDVGLPQMRKEDSTAAEALTSVKVKISDIYFLIALAKGDADTARNLDLMQTRSWFDFPLLLNDDRIAKVVFQKSSEGQAMLEKAFDAWK
jgi:cytoskeletal protein RodZ